MNIQELPCNIADRIRDIREDCNHIKPLVVIHTLAFNHEPYIRDTLEGIVKQKTTFPFVAIVHEDASTDRTAEIIREYEKKYPDIIKPIYEKENQYSRKDNSLGRIMKQACIATEAKYVAWCEGDDYWTDPNKLQMQVDFLEKHPDYSLCFHNVNVLHQNTVGMKTQCGNVESRDYTAQEVFNRWVIPTCSAVMRIDCAIKTPVHRDFIVGDNVLWATCLSMGKIHGFKDVMGVYRRVETGWTARMSKSRDLRHDTGLKWIKHYKAMIACFPNIDESVFNTLIIDSMAYVSLLEFLTFNKQFITNFRKYNHEFGYAYRKQFYKRIYNFIKKRI